MDISGLVSELSEIITEEKRIRGHMRELRSRREKIEGHVAKFFEETEDPGIKYRGLTITVEDKIVRLHKKKTEKIDGALNVLKEYGVKNADQVLGNVIEAMRGHASTETKVIVKKAK